MFSGNFFVINRLHVNETQLNIFITIRDDTCTIKSIHLEVDEQGDAEVEFIPNKGKADRLRGTLDSESLIINGIEIKNWEDVNKVFESK